jgi:hypothetical protein
MHNRRNYTGKIEGIEKIAEMLMIYFAPKVIRQSLFQVPPVQNKL